MASRRFVDRGFWKCRELNGLPATTRLLAIYLFSDEADDFGRAKADPYRLRSGCFPDDEITDAEIETMVDALADAGFVKRYFARDGRPLLWLPTFHDYQPMRYWAISRLDRHPDDDFEAVDTKMVKGKKSRISRPIAPLGHIEATCHNSPKVAESCENSPQSASPIPIPIPIPTPVPVGAPEGQRAVPDTANGLSASAAEPLDVDAGTAHPEGRGPDAPATNGADSDNGSDGHDSDHDALSGADDPKAASGALTLFERLTSAYNGSDSKLPQIKSTARAKSLVLTYEGRVGLLATTLACKSWKSLAMLLKRSGPAPPGKHEERAEAKRMLEGMG
jgi:hypothetical protein